VLQITRRVDYALIALTHLALHPNQRINSRELAEGYSLSRPLMANVLKALAKGELVCSVRGTKGGYELACEPSAIAVGRVVEFLEGPLQLATCITDDAGDDLEDHLTCSVSRVCPVKHSVFKIHLKIRDVLYAYSIADLAGGAAPPSGSALPMASVVAIRSDS